VWTPFQTHCYSEKLIAPSIDTVTSGSPARNSGHQNTQAVPSKSHKQIKVISIPEICKTKKYVEKPVSANGNYAKPPINRAYYIQIMGKFIQLPSRNANGLTQHAEELKTSLSIHNIDGMLISEAQFTHTHTHTPKKHRYPKIPNVRWVPFSQQHGASSSCGWRVAAYIMNKHPRRYKAWSSSLGVGRGSNNPSP
jgi:hypothetical protein